MLAARGRNLEIPNTQAKAPAPPRWINSLQSKVGQAFSLPNFRHGLLAMIRLAEVRVPIDQAQID
jgi:hypothetical protein